MKFKFKPQKSNLFFMSSVIILCLFTCIIWLILREYIYFSIYFLLTLVIAYTYYRTKYIIEDKYLIIKLGFLKIKINYQKITEAKKENDYVKVKFIKYGINIYPNNKDIFILKINEKLTEKI